ncbi:MAG: helicase [Prevotella sp.]|nr:helicase [Prevotella sp.]
MNFTSFSNEDLEKLAKPEEYRKGLFIEVGGQIRKLSSVTKADGKEEDVYIPWAKESLFRAYGKDFVNGTIFPEMPKLDGETLKPDHINYKMVIGRRLNTYHPLPWKPISGPYWSHIGQLYRHIFEEQFELGLDYTQKLYIDPMAKLPLLLLISQENNTGKSTFCNFLKKMFGDNATGMNSEGLRSRFTSTWVNKLLVFVEEKLLDKDSDGDMIKNLVTGFTAQSEAKGKDRVEVPFFAKLVMTSNNIYTPIVLHEDDTRTWVREIKPLPPRVPGSHDFLTECEKEIPYFLDFLLHRKLSIECEDRLFFSPKRLRTPAWQRIVNSCRSNLEKQVAEKLLEIMNDCEIDTLRYSVANLLDMLSIEHIKTDRVQLKQLLAERWKLPTTSKEKERYDLYTPNIGGGQKYIRTSTTGKWYEFRKDFLCSLTV